MATVAIVGVGFIAASFLRFKGAEASLGGSDGGCWPPTSCLAAHGSTTPNHAAVVAAADLLPYVVLLCVLPLCVHAVVVRLRRGGRSDDLT